MIEETPSSDIESYDLPIIDVQEKRRNFSGYQVNQFVTLADLQQGDSSGTTDTDEGTVGNDSDESGATRLNKKIKGLKDKWPSKRS